MTEENQYTLFTAGEAYIQSTANKWLKARKHLRQVIGKINKAIDSGKFYIDIEPDHCTDVDIEFLQNHGYKYNKPSDKYYARISWDIKENET